MTKNWDLLEEFDFHVKVSLLDFVQNSQVSLFADQGKMSLSDRSYSCLPFGRLIYKGKFAETLACIKSNDLDEPFKILVLLEQNKFLQFTAIQVEIFFESK